MRKLIEDKEKQMVAFYILYFGWLFTLTTLTVEVKWQNYFAIVVVLFYFIFLRDIWDPLWFSLFALGSVLYRLFPLESEMSAEYFYEELGKMEVWLPLSWGTTAVALRKFFIIVNQRLVK